MSLIRRIIATSAVAAAGIGLVAAGLADTGREQAPVQTVADGEPGYAVEDFNYPQADKIEQELGIILKRGDGHITLAECGSAEGLLEVYSRQTQKICFRATGDSGFLTMEIPAVYGVKAGAEHDASLKLTADGETQNVFADKNSFKPAGEALDPDGRDHVLVEIRTSK
ncbi:hypothetical protein ACLGIH_22935 [Streptomyces sp. HMX87]|uniref:hypothetical protein n=1 Tax=Streptomyces sp. HMX87 TaxID=3390849 RepID=UPI003A885F20